MKTFTVRFKMAPAIAGTATKHVDADDMLDAAIKARNFLGLRFPNHIIVSISEGVVKMTPAEARAFWYQKVEARR